MKEDVQNEEQINSIPPQTCDGKEKPKDPPNPGDRGYWDCQPSGWVWIPAA